MGPGACRVCPCLAACFSLAGGQWGFFGETTAQDHGGSIKVRKLGDMHLYAIMRITW